MITRIFSWGSRAAALLVAVATCGVTASGQDRPGYFTDPATGIVYRQVTRSVERPVVETKIEQQEQTVYRPQTVKETRPETKTVFTPVTEYQWQTYVQGRWNPFRQPTVAYKPVPQTRWEARSEVVNRTETRTQWVAEKRTVEVPHRIVRMDREQKVDYEVVGRVAPQATHPNTAPPSIASRLQPLASNTNIQPLATTLPSPAANQFAGPQIAGTVGRMTSDPPRRSTSQSGMRTTELYPTGPTVYGSALPAGSTGIANLPGLSLWR
jgi:hypothetical protein